ncbi:neprilysin [Exaiptasia diaphana]|uniref:Uncharacterized protein n=1 Tax=Exaiptasia diaphana TaxID=2652724 RepID=A0A913X9N1_EXADI|nr:neprilysin [Exaiptasia diaphana]KXJ13722.1 Neprilysin [Exaiptasia diaphana]
MNRDTEEFIDDHRVYFKVKKTCFPILVAVSVILAVIAITFIVLYSQAVDKRETTTIVPKPGKKYKICNEDSCFAIGKSIVHSLNQSADPCKDFYAYACGGWQERHPLSKGQNILKVSTLLHSEIQVTLKFGLENAKQNYSKNVAVMKTARFYKSCTNTTAIESSGIQPLIKLIDDYGGWSIFNNTDFSVSIETRIAKAARELGVDSLISARAITDEYNSSNTILSMQYAVLTFPQTLYLNKSKAAQDQVKKAINEFSKLFELNGTTAKLWRLYDFETKLAQIQSGKTPKEELMESVQKSIKKKEPIDDYRIKMNDFCTKSGFSCPLLKRILKMTYGRSFTGNEILLVTNITYFKNLYKLYQNTLDSGNGDVIRDYVMWRAIRQYLGAVTLNASSMNPSARENACIDQLMMNAFDMTLGLMYVNAKFDFKSKTTVEEMTNDLKQSFVNRLPQQTWMDAETQRQAKEKALAMRVLIGYPEYIKNPKKLENHYKLLNISDEFFENIKALKHFLRMREINTYGKPIDKNAWSAGESPAKVNGFYTFNENKITYLAGILQLPFYSSEYPSYMQYGGIGMVIGHELTHGFDSNGRQYDKNGNLYNWWSHSSDANFKQKSKCFVNQYNKYQLHGINVNGSLTINENIADNGGIKIAYDAYQRWASRNGTEKILPGLELTPDQLFFISFAQEWCGVFNIIGASFQLKDVHSPGRFRVIGSLSNFPKFSEAFKCPTNSPLNPEKKCSVW